MTAQLIVQEVLGHTKVADANQLDVFTSQGWRLVAIVQETYPHQTFVPTTPEEQKGMGYVTTYGGGPPSPYDPQPPWMQQGLKLQVVPCTSVRFLIARHGDGALADLAAKLEEAARARDEWIQDAGRHKVEASNAKARAEQAEKAQLEHKNRAAQLEEEARVAREQLRTRQQAVHKYEADIAKLRKALGDMQIDTILKSKP